MDKQISRLLLYNDDKVGQEEEPDFGGLAEAIKNNSMHNKKLEKKEEN